MKARDDFQKQAAAERTQCRQIMTMSSQLQLKGADESRQHRVDRERWKQDRRGMQRQIENLEAGKLTLIPSESTTGSATSVLSDDVLTIASMNVLGKETIQLHRSYINMEAILQEIKRETDQTDHAMTTVSEMREKINSKLHHRLHDAE